jgi:hypothetical protein
MGRHVLKASGHRSCGPYTTLSICAEFVWTDRTIGELERIWKEDVLT